MKKRTLAIVAAMVMVMALALAACSRSQLSVETDDAGIHAVAEGTSEGSGTGSITIAPEEGICINHIVDKGSFHVTITNVATDEVVFDGDVEDNIANFIDANGEFDVVITANDAQGKVDIIAYDKAAQAAADASLDDALGQGGVDREDTGL